MPEQDLYLVLPQCDHNFKLRSGALEMKWRVEQRAGGYSLWQDKVVWTFPLADETAAQVAWAACQRQVRVQDRRIGSAQALVAWLRHLEPQLQVIPVLKQRARLDLGGARLEVAEMVLHQGNSLLSICVDGYHLPAVRAVVHRSGLIGWGRPMGYVEMLREAVWWLPALERKEEGTKRGQHPEPPVLGLL